MSHSMFRWLARPQRDLHPLIEKFDAAAPLDMTTAIDDCKLLAIDMELTGLDPHRDHIVSIGWVPIRHREIVLAEARHYLIRPPISVGQSATIHGLHDRDLDGASPLEGVLTELLEDYAGYVLVAHNAVLDIAFLRMATKRIFGLAPQFVAIDTLWIEKRHMDRRDQTFKENGLRLNACLHRHSLPMTKAHNALEDAYGCALLLLAQTARSNGPVILRDLLKIPPRWILGRFLRRMGFD